MSSDVTDLLGDRRTIRVTDVFEGDALLDAEGGELVCSEDALRFDDREGERLTIPHGDVERVRVDVDRSVAGFRVIGNAFGVVGLLMLYVFVQLFRTSAPLVSVVGVGSAASAALGFYGAVWFRRMEVGERAVLRVDRGDGSRSTFITGDDDGTFDRIEERLSRDGAPK